MGIRLSYYPEKSLAYVAYDVIALKTVLCGFLLLVVDSEGLQNENRKSAIIQSLKNH